MPSYDMGGSYLPTAGETINLLTHIYSEITVKKHVMTKYGAEYLQMLHYIKTGSRFCPRVLLTAERIIRSAHHKGGVEWENMKQLISTRVSEVLDESL